MGSRSSLGTGAFIALVLAGALFASAPANSPIAPADVAAGVRVHEGTVAHYRVTFGEQARDDSFRTETLLDITFVRVLGDWLAICRGTTMTHIEGQPDARAQVRAMVALDPPRGPITASVGDEVGFDAVTSCMKRGLVATIREETTLPWGRPPNIGAFHADDVPECRCQETNGDWSTLNGLVLQWAFLGQDSHMAGRLVWTNVRLR